MINFITWEDFKEIETTYDYYKNRWSYHEDSIYLLKKTRINFSNAIELGAYKLPLIKNSETIDKQNQGDTTYVFDANDITKWREIPNKKYDLFIGMQVLEHLSNQSEIWKEIQRISNHALISLPYMWYCVGNCHHGIDEEIIYKWTQMKPNYSIISGNDKESSARRIISFYSFGGN